MPRNKKEGIIFGVTMCFLMVCGMSTYNLALVGKLNFAKFAIGLIPGFIVAFFFDTVIVGPVAKKMAFKLPINGYRNGYIHVYFWLVNASRNAAKYCKCLFYWMGNELYCRTAIAIANCRPNFTVKAANVAKIF